VKKALQRLEGALSQALRAWNVLLGWVSVHGRE
jgi:hypothetical protein